MFCIILPSLGPSSTGPGTTSCNMRCLIAARSPAPTVSIVPTRFCSCAAASSPNRCRTHSFLFVSRNESAQAPPPVRRCRRSCVLPGEQGAEGPAGDSLQGKPDQSHISCTPRGHLVASERDCYAEEPCSQKQRTCRPLRGLRARSVRRPSAPIVSTGTVAISNLQPQIFNSGN